MACLNAHPLDQQFMLLLNTLQLNEFSDYYRGTGVLSDCDIEKLGSPQFTRRDKINHLVSRVKTKDANLKWFKWALKNSDQSAHKDLLDKLESALKANSESARETPDRDLNTLTRSLSSLSLDNYSHTIDVNCDFTQICCSGCTSPINVIGDTADFVNVYKRTNPHGYVHRFYTLEGISTKCRINRVGTWTKEHTWFEHFWWKIINCADCNLHWGWHFENRDGSQGFYGIRKDAICLRAKK